MLQRYSLGEEGERLGFEDVAITIILLNIYKVINTLKILIYSE